MSANDDRYWDRRIETLPLDDLAVVQDHRLQWQMQRCWLGSPFYRERIERAGLGQRDVRTRADLARLPILVDRDLRADRRAAPPLGSATVAPVDWWVEQRTLDDLEDGAVVLTDGDAIHRAGLAARALWAIGLRPGGAGPSGAEPSVEVSSDGPEARSAADAAVAGGLDKIGLTKADLVNPGATPARARPAEAAPAHVIWQMTVPVGGLRVPDRGSAEPFQILGHARIGPVAAFECEARAGLHWPMDHYLLEVVDPATLTPLPEGRAGALLVTHLTREGSPLIRYWTGWETRLDSTPCPCGRTGARSATVLPARPIVDED